MDRANHRASKLALLVVLAATTAWMAHASQRSKPAPIVPTASPLAAQEAPRIEVAFVLDTTGSMSGLIEGAKQKIWSIANQLASGTPKPDIRIGLVGYRDRGDAYVTRLHDLSDDIDAVYAQLRGFQASGGGDTPESVNQALFEGISQMSWSPGQEVYKVIFLVGDAPPHMDYPGEPQYPSALQLAQRKHIVVNAIQCGSLASTAPVWRAIAAGGFGEYASIGQDGQMVAIATPLDDELSRLGRALTKTMVAYGADKDKEELRRKASLAASAPASVAAARLGFLAKKGGRANSGRSDLIDAVKNAEVELEAMSDDSLPEEMRSLDRHGRKRYVEEKIAERDALQSRITRLPTEREDYVRRESDRLRESGESDGFDQQVLNAIRKQAAAKGIDYGKQEGARSDAAK